MADFIYPHDYFNEVPSNLDPKLCFVLMPFAPELRSVFDAALAPAASECGLKCLRADDIYSTRPILVDVMTFIANAAFVIADLTGRNPNVFYELGLSHVVKENPRVILISQDRDDIPFDLRHLRLVVYEQTGEGLRQLRSNLALLLHELQGATVIDSRLSGGATLRIQSLAVKIGHQFEAPIILETRQRVEVYGFNVKFDPSVLDVVAARSSYGVCNHRYAPGMVRINGMLPTPSQGTLELGRVTFEAVSGGRTDLALENVELTQASGFGIQPLNLVNGLVAIS